MIRWLHFAGQLFRCQPHQMGFKLRDTFTADIAEREKIRSSKSEDGQEFVELTFNFCYSEFVNLVDFGNSDGQLLDAY